jgi:hypothetical protein
VLGTAAGGLGAGLNVPASAGSGRTYLYAAGMGGLWRGPAIRPRDVAFGAHYAVERLSWSRWSAGSASGRGHYYGFGSYEANVRAYDVKVHDGRRYFSWLKITDHGRRTRYLKYSDGFWHTE